jgi:membrane protease YdiL (CAAX protease family)/LysM repeat protein
LLIAAFFAGRIADITNKMQGFTLRAIPAQVMISLTGVGLGYLEFLILRPQPLIAEFTLQQIWIPALILLIFTGFLEEWIFRGLMQYTALRIFGRSGFIYVAAVFAVLHLGYKSLLDVLFVFVVALFFGWVVLKTGSILGATLAHGLTNIGLFLVFPFLIGSPLVVAPGVATPTPAVQQPGLLAPIAPTEQATRPFLPPTHTPRPPTLTPTLTITPSPSVTPEWTLTPSVEVTATVCGQPAGWVTYTIRAGDTLSSLAQRFGTSVAELMQANCMTSSAIQAGQVIFVPNVPGALPTPTKTPIPIATSFPTDIPEPSRTPTEIPQPSDTPTDIPSPIDTPTDSPTETLTPTPSDTPVPSETSSSGG